MHCFLIILLISVEIENLYTFITIDAILAKMIKLIA